MKNIYFRTSQGFLFFSLQVFSNNRKIPQAELSDGLLTCLRLCISIVGVEDSVRVVNNSDSPKTARISLVYTSGYSHFSDIRIVTLKNSSTSDFILFPIHQMALLVSNLIIFLAKKR